MWSAFVKEHEDDFGAISQRYATHPLFSENSDELNIALYGCYPLHPVSTFILPRLSERVAQNERTLFTFLSAAGSATLPSYLACSDDRFEFITPDVIYDYFEPLFKKEVYAGEALVTRDLIADSTECMAMAHGFDGLVCIPNCAKLYRHSIRIPMPFRRRRLVPERLSL